MKVKYVVYLIFIFYFILLFVKNNIIIHLDFIFKELDVSFYIVVIAAFLLGSLNSAVLLYKKIKKYKKKSKEIQK